MVEGAGAGGAGGGNVNRLILLQCNTGHLWVRVLPSETGGSHKDTLIGKNLSWVLMGIFIASRRLNL